MQHGHAAGVTDELSVQNQLASCLPNSKTTLSRVGERWAEPVLGFPLGQPSALCGSPARAESLWGRSASSVLISRATLCCNLSFTRRRKGKNMKLQNSYLRLMCVMCVYRYYKREFSSIASCPYSLCPVSFNLTQFLTPSATLCRLSGDKG